VLVEQVCEFIEAGCEFCFPGRFAVSDGGGDTAGVNSLI
jgi:hypothetical protein